MSYGLKLQGTGRGRGLLRRFHPDQLFDTLAQKLAQTLPSPFSTIDSAQVDSGGHRGTLLLHPAAPPVAVVVGPKAKITVQAQTSAGGPGYHRFLSRLLKALAVDWQEISDDTGYFKSENDAALDAFALQSLAATAKEILAFQGRPPLHVALRATARFEFDAFSLTPLGPRDRAFWEQVSRDPETGTEVVPWWREPLDAKHFLDRALCRMWSDVRWRRAVDMHQARASLEVHAFLSAAKKLDASLPLPDREWKEMLDLLEEGIIDDEMAQEVRTASIPSPPTHTIGYRRGNVLVDLGEDWQMTVPGAFFSVIDDEGTYHGYDDRGAAHVSLYAADPEDIDEIHAEGVDDLVKDKDNCTVCHIVEPADQEADQQTQQNVEAANQEKSNLFRKGCFCLVEDEEAGELAIFFGVTLLGEEFVRCNIELVDVDDVTERERVLKWWRSIVKIQEASETN